VLVWLASFPRSGNTLTMRTLADVYGIKRLCTIFQDQLLMKGWRRGYRLPAELVGLPKDELLEALRARPEPFFVKSHRIEDSADPAPALYCVRDGRDVQVSLAHWIKGKKNGPYRLPFDERLGVLVSSDSWSRNVRAWRTRTAPTALVRFEELVADPASTVKRACDELGVALPEPTGELTSFEELKAKNPLMHRRGKPGSWREEMSPANERSFWRLHREEMEALGYTERRGDQGEGVGARLGRLRAALR
jgi:hypothetical protein